MSGEFEEASKESSERTAMAFTADATRAELRRHVLDIAATAPEDSRKAYEAAHKLIEARQQYEKTRAEYLEAASPRMARLAPPPASGTDVQENSEAPVVTK